MDDADARFEQHLQGQPLLVRLIFVPWIWRLMQCVAFPYVWASEKRLKVIFQCEDV